MAKFNWNQLQEESPPSNNPKPPGKFDWGQLQEESPKQPAANDEPTFLSEAGNLLLKGAAKVGETVDKYAGAPTRAAISSLQDDVTEPGKAVTAFRNQFGEDPRKAPTGKDIVKRAGVPDTALSEVAPGLYNDTGEGWKLKRGGLLDPTASGVAGVAMDVAADPTNILQAGLKPASALARAGVGTLAKSASKIGEAATAVGELTSKAGTKLTTKLGTLFTGVPEKEIETFINQYPEVQKLIKEYGDDIPGAADKIREGFQSSIRSRRQALGAQVGEALKALPDEKVVDLTPVVEQLNQVKSRMNGKLQLEEVKQVDDLINRVKSLGDETGKVTPKEMFDVKQFLQDRGSGAFMKDGQIFVPGKDAQIAAKNASREARDIVNRMSPTVAEANGELSRLHVMESQINKNLIAPGKSDAALTAAGSGNNLRNAKELELMGNITGKDALGDAERLSAAKRFAHPGLSAADTTGKAVERNIKAGLVGMAVGGPVAGGVAMAATSPLALKAAIQVGRVPVKAIQAIAGATGALSDATIQRAYKILQTPQGQKAFDAAVQGARVDSIEGQAASSLRNVADDQPKKGEDKWAQTGLQKLGIQDRGLASTLLQSKEGKRLLIEASDLTPGSNALKRIQDRIQKGYGRK